MAEAVQTGGQTLLLPVRFDSAPASLPSISKADRVTGESSGEWTIYVWVDDVMVSVTNAVDLSECVGDGGSPRPQSSPTEATAAVWSRPVTKSE